MSPRRFRRMFAAVAAFALLATACGDDDSSGATDGDEIDVPDGPTIVIGAQDFGESAILAEAYGQAFEAAGYPVRQQSLGGFRDIVYTSFSSGDINFTAEYAASALEFLNDLAGEASNEIDDTAAKLRAQLADVDLHAYDHAPAVNSNAFVVTSETADELGLSEISDLTSDLRLGAPPDCEENASCIPGLIEVYDLDLSANYVPLDGGGPLTREALAAGQIDVAVLFSTDGAIAENDWVILEDDMGLINADNIIPVTTDEVADAYGDDLTELIDEISAALTTEELTELNRRFDIDKEDADDVAADWLESNGFI